MNGLGNEITVLDLRGTAVRVSAAEARAIAADPRSRFDQLMVLHDPVTPGTDAYHAHLQHRRLGIRRLRQRHPLRRLGDARPTRHGPRRQRWPRARDQGRASAGRARLRHASSPSIWARRGSPGTRSPCAIPFRTPASIAVDTDCPRRPILQAPSVVSMGNPHAIFWVDDAGPTISPRIGPILENHPVFPERANISLRPGHQPRAHRAARLGARRRRRPAPADRPPAPPSWRRPQGPDGPQGDRGACPAAISSIEWRDSDDHVLMTGPIELEHEGTFPPALFAGAA